MISRREFIALLGGQQRGRCSDARYTGHVRHRAARSARPERAHAVGRRERAASL